MTIRRRTKKSGSSSPPNPPKLELVRAPTNPLEEDIRELQLREDVFRMKSEGYTHSEISKALGIGPKRITELVMESIDAYNAKHEDEVRKFIAMQKARYDRIYRTWMPRAEGFTREVIDADTGDKHEVIEPPDPEAARVVLMAMRDAAKMMGLNKMRVEHTGANGGAINIDVDWNTISDEQLARFVETGDPGILRAVAGAFASASAARTPEASGTEG